MAVGHSLAEHGEVKSEVQGGKGARLGLYSGGKLGERNDRPRAVKSSVASVGLSFRCAALYRLKSRPPFGVGYKYGEALPIW